MTERHKKTGTWTLYTVKLGMLAHCKFNGHGQMRLICIREEKINMAFTGAKLANGMCSFAYRIKAGFFFYHIQISGVINLTTQFRIDLGIVIEQINHLYNISNEYVCACKRYWEENSLTFKTFFYLLRLH